MYMPYTEFEDAGFTIVSETSTYYRCKIIKYNTEKLTAILTTSGGQLLFALPLYKRFPYGTTIVSMKGHIGKLDGSSHSGEHREIIQELFGVNFDTSQSVVVKFTNAANVEKTVTQKPTLSLQGGSCLIFNSGNLGAGFFTAGINSWGDYNDYTNELNNNPCTIELNSVEIVFQIPKVA